MKSMIALALLTAVSTTGFSAPFVEANLYNCSARGLNVSLSTSSLLGTPQMHLSGNEVSGFTFSEPELATTKMGLQASVSVANINDATIDYTLIVPTVNTQDFKEHTVSGLLIKTMGGGLMSPDRIPGPLQTNTVTKLKCVAQKVDF
ncbi:MAG: hypothetical protein M3Q07_03870 [Pseudobdellovibrionaceae bacterium]|nr:hypothetical protein [Pseudobdellovibrionaceae bacterium]